MKNKGNMVMRFRTMNRHLKEGFKNIFRNGWMSFASIGAVTVTLVLFGAFLVLILNLNQMASKIESDVEIKVLIDRMADSDVIADLGEDIKELNGVESTSFASNDEELESLIDSMGEEGEAWLLFEQDNPLNHAYIVKAKDPTETEKLATTIEDFNGVKEVNYGKD